MGEREHLRTTTAGAALCLVLAVAIGCGRSLKDDHDGDGSSGSSSGGSAGEVGGTSGSSGEGGSSALGGSSGSGGTSAQGGSAEGGSSQGGSSGTGGEGGATPIPTRLLVQTGNALLAIDPDTVETTEVCPDATTPVRYDLIDWVNERAIVFRLHSMAPAAGEVLRVALDGSECTSLLLSESVYAALQPVASNHVVLAINPVLMSAFGAPNGDARLRRPIGLASFALDGTELQILAPNGVLSGQIAGDSALFMQSVANAGYDAFSALPSTGSVTPLVPAPGSKSIDIVRGRRVVVSDRTAGSLWAVDTDGANLVTLDGGAEIDYGAGFVGDRVIVSRSIPTSSSTQSDLFSVDENGGVLVPIASSVDHEMFRGSVGERVVYERATDLYTVRLDGTDPRRFLETAGLGEEFAATVGERVIFRSVGSPASTFYSAESDGSDLVTLHRSSSAFAGAVGGRIMLYIGEENYDLVSVPISGGDPWLLADGPLYDWLVGSLGTMLVIQRGDRVTEGEVLRINADGSQGTLLHASARFIGSVSEACGAVVAGYVNPPCPE